MPARYIEEGKPIVLRLIICTDAHRLETKEKNPIDTSKNKHDLIPDRHSERRRTPLQRGWYVWGVELLLRSRWTQMQHPRTTP